MYILGNPLALVQHSTLLLARWQDMCTLGKAFGLAQASLSYSLSVRGCATFGLASRHVAGHLATH